jgi:hypothetical protein
VGLELVAPKAKVLPFDNAPKCRHDGCFGMIVPIVKDGRFRKHREILINIPADFPVLQCTNCGQDYFTKESQAEYTEMLEREYQEHATLVSTVIEKYRRRQAKK